MRGQAYVSPTWSSLTLTANSGGRRYFVSIFTNGAFDKYPAQAGRSRVPHRGAGPGPQPWPFCFGIKALRGFPSSGGALGVTFPREGQVEKSPQSAKHPPVFLADQGCGWWPMRTGTVQRELERSTMGPGSSGPRPGLQCAPSSVAASSLLVWSLRPSQASSTGQRP